MVARKMLILQTNIQPRIVNSLDELQETIPEYGLWVHPDLRLLEVVAIHEFLNYMPMSSRDLKDLEDDEDW